MHIADLWDAFRDRRISLDNFPQKIYNLAADRKNKEKKT
jgi:hypothetical protein